MERWDDGGALHPRRRSAPAGARRDAQACERPVNKHYPHLAGKPPAPCKKRSENRTLIFRWWAREDSNLQPSGYEPLALTIELRARAARACEIPRILHDYDCARSEVGVAPAPATKNYPRRLNKNTACSPNRFQNHHGIFSRMRRPQALSATAS